MWNVNLYSEILSYNEITFVKLLGKQSYVCLLQEGHAIGRDMEIKLNLPPLFILNFVLVTIVSEEFPLLAIDWAIEWTLEYVLICRAAIKVTLVLMQKTEKQYRTYYTNDLIFPDIEMSRRSAAILNCEYLSSL